MGLRVRGLWFPSCHEAPEAGPQSPAWQNRLRACQLPREDPGAGSLGVLARVVFIRTLVKKKTSSLSGRRVLYHAWRRAWLGILHTHPLPNVPQLEIQHASHPMSQVSMEAQALGYLDSLGSPVIRVLAYHPRPGEPKAQSLIPKENFRSLPLPT